jgi:hypothetical protein
VFNPAIVPFQNRALNFSPNVFFWEQFRELLESTMPLIKLLIKEIVGGGAKQNRAFQRGDDTSSHNKNSARRDMPIFFLPGQ